MKSGPLKTPVIEVLQKLMSPLASVEKKEFKTTLVDESSGVWKPSDIVKEKPGNVVIGVLSKFGGSAVSRVNVTVRLSEVISGANAEVKFGPT